MEVTAGVEITTKATVVTMTDVDRAIIITAIEETAITIAQWSKIMRREKTKTKVATTETVITARMGIEAIISDHAVEVVLEAEEAITNHVRNNVRPTERESKQIASDKTSMVQPMRLTQMQKIILICMQADQHPRNDNTYIILGRMKRISKTRQHRHPRKLRRM